jgi:hypothetical protein
MPKNDQPATADRLVDLALERYRFGLTQDGEPFAEHRGGPRVALMLRGSRGLRAELAKLFRRAYDRTPSASALADALAVLEGEAAESPPEPVWLRTAPAGGGRIAIDLGDTDGGVVLLGPDGWTVADRSPVLFRRSKLTGPLPLPERGGRLDELRELLNVGDDSWPLLVGWLVACLLPELPHPVLLFGGCGGSGKSTAARLLVGVVDPSPAPLRSEPRDAEQWSIAASAAWVCAIDNVSNIPPWLSDALCKAVTGDAFVRRALYTDGDVAVSAFRRCVALTSIDPGALRGDLASRLLMVELESIDKRRRRTEADLDAAFEASRPRLFGALLDAAVGALRELPAMAAMTELPRLADFGRLLGACDTAGVTRGAFELFAGQGDRLAADVLEGDPFAQAMIGFVRGCGRWVGTASDLLASIPAPERPPRGWPGTPKAVGGRLKRLGPSLLDGARIQCDHFRETDSARQRRIELRDLDAGEAEDYSAAEPSRNDQAFDVPQIRAGVL